MNAPLLPFDAVSPSLPRKRGQTERARLNAAALRVLAYLKQHGSATNVELCDPRVGGMRAIGRVDELRRDGWNVTKQHVQGGIWRYTLEGYR